MKKYNMIIPEGTRDFLFEESYEKRKIQNSVSDIFSKRGYKEVITPGLEYFDVFDLDGAGIPQEEMYKSTDNKGRLLVFKPDLTLPVARLTATRLQNIKPPIRIFYNQNVYRNRPDLSGRSDESNQAGVELIGIGGLKADLEVISTAVEAMKNCFDNFRIEIGHAGIFRVFAQKLNLSNDLKEDIRSKIESKNYAALNDILDSLEDSHYKKALASLPRLFGGAEVFTQAKEYCTDEVSADILSYLETLYSALEKLGLGDKIMVDLGLVQRNDYYTGVVFSSYAYGHGDAILVGGRYDNLLEKFSTPMPAIGFAIDVDAVVKIKCREDLTLETPDFLIHADKGFETEGEIYLNQLTSKGFVCEYSLFETREEAQVYAEDKGIKNLIYIDKPMM